MSLGNVRAPAREVIALVRNLRHAAILRRELRAKYGAMLVGKSNGMIDDALVAMHKGTWKRLAVLAVLLVVAVRR